MSINSLDVQADKGIYKRFDRFNNKYNPLGTPKLREVFLKTDNHIKGRYLAELTKELMTQLDEQ
jgi:AMP deaminase